jgi:hypothetical protein
MIFARSSLARVLFLALALALAANASAMEADHDHDHDSHDDDAADWACTATCGAASAAHPCGAGKFVPSELYSTCNLTKTNIMDIAKYATATHVVPCPIDVCAVKCAVTGANADEFKCFNTSVLLDMSSTTANERALAMGCLGNHYMNDTEMYMAGENHGACEAGYVHYHEEAASSDASRFTALGFVFAFGAAVASLA